MAKNGTKQKTHSTEFKMGVIMDIHKQLNI